MHLSLEQEEPLKLTLTHFSQMKKGAMIVNVARGQFIEEEDLYTSLTNGHLGGAALDVFLEEPYEGKLKELSNVILTPHIGSLTVESRVQMEVQAIKNLVEYFKRNSEAPRSHGHGFLASG